MKALELIRKAVDIASTDGFRELAGASITSLGSWKFTKRKEKANVLDSPSWRNINYKALGLAGDGKLLLDPSDVGFSREFYAYGFREPLNTLAIFKTIEKKKPAILDIGSNLGYFPLVELQAGAKHVVAVEPIPSTFILLSKTLKDFRNLTLLNTAISDKRENLRLYIANEHNVTSSSITLITESGHTVSKEISVEAIPLSTMAEQYPINMVRMDVEGHEYRILSGHIPDSIETICIELHILPPYGKKHAAKLLQHLNRQGFQATIVINEMGYGLYPLINHLGLKTTYKLVRSLKEKALGRPNVQRNISLIKLINKVEEGVLHLIMER